MSMPLAAWPQQGPAHPIDSINHQLDLLEQSRNPNGALATAQQQQQQQPQTAGSFFEQLSGRVLAANSLLCVGLDPHAADIGNG